MAEVLVRGAGPVGCVAAMALARSHRVRLEGRPAASLAYPVALSHASRLILERLGAWGGFDCTPIDAVSVTQAASWGRTHLSSADAGVPRLGYVVRYDVLAAALQAAAAARGLHPASSPSSAPPACLVRAEGAADVPARSYGQSALSCFVDVDGGHGQVAHERFTAEGPLALLPHGRGFGVVWVMAAARAVEMLAMPAQPFLAALSRAAGPALAAPPIAVQDRAVHELALRRRSARIGAREVFIGNAAQALHPVAGQGLNLGLRDAWALAALLRDAPDPGEDGLLARYARTRALDACATIGVTDFLARGFLGSAAPLRAARGGALAILDVAAPARRFFARRMIFGVPSLS